MSIETVPTVPPADLPRTMDTLRHLDQYALGVIHDRVQLAYQIQEGTKADILRRLKTPDNSGAEEPEK